jgi:hypothetical protein
MTQVSACIVLDMYNFSSWTDTTSCLRLRFVNIFGRREREMNVKMRFKPALIVFARLFDKGRLSVAPPGTEFSILTRNAVAAILLAYEYFEFWFLNSSQRPTRCQHFSPGDVIFDLHGTWMLLKGCCCPSTECCCRGL